MERSTVQACNVKSVGQVNNDLVTPVGLDHRTWHLAFDNETNAVNTIGRDGLVSDGPEELASLAGLWRNRVPVVVDVISAPLLWVAARLTLARNAATGTSWRSRAGAGASGRDEGVRRRGVASARWVRVTGSATA